MQYKCFLNPDIKCLPGKTNYKQRNFELAYHYGGGNAKDPATGFASPALSAHAQCGHLQAAPGPRPGGAKPPTYRFPSGARPSEFTAPEVVLNEEDILHL